MRNTNQWYVITGGPSSGITSTANFLALFGYQTVPEAARILIDTEISKGKTIEEIRKDELLFQKKVLEMKQEIESKFPRDRIIFFQRGIPDTLAYYRLIGADTSEIINVCKNSYYRKVFILEPLSYRQDYARTEGEKKAKKLFKLLKQAYSELGMETIIIPKASINERAALILKNITQD
ncbi:MAG: hypothetical protein DRP18_02840 [Candidatus Aenigmatarchaeota archaeon]|nr:MAG: hypothetical protein DRP18_02840 [Candidatus Aenigmarchaeota archaeon]RLJ06758.1 MAG: hypothetical protein DRP16_04725 [Candidatus Aenigmarchaeota archaeon]